MQSLTTLALFLSILVAPLWAQESGTTTAGAPADPAGTPADVNADRVDAAEAESAPAAPVARQDRPRRPGWEILGGRLTFRFRSRVMYDSNVFLEGNNENPDLVFIFAPSAQFTYRREGLRFAAGWEYEQWMFEENEDADRPEHTGFGRFLLEDGPFYGGISANFQRVAQPTAIGGTTANIVVRLATVTGLVGLKIGELISSPDSPSVYGSRLEYQVDRVRLTSPTALVSFYEHGLWLHTLRLRTPFMDEALWTYLEGTLGWTNFDEETKDDDMIRRARLGADWTAIQDDETLGDLSIGGYVGYEYRDYKDSSGANAFTSDYQNPIWGASVRWAPWETDEFSGGVTYGPQESTLTNYQRILRFTAGWTHEFTEELMLNVNASWEQSTEGEDSTQRFKHRRQIEGVLQYSFTPDIVADFTLLYRDKATSDDAGEYDDLQASVGISIRW